MTDHRDINGHPLRVGDKVWCRFFEPNGIPVSGIGEVRTLKSRGRVEIYHERAEERTFCREAKRVRREGVAS